MRLYLNKNLQENGCTHFKLDGIQKYIYEVHVQEGEQFSAKTIKDDGRNTETYQGYDLTDCSETITEEIESLLECYNGVRGYIKLLTLPLVLDAEENLGIFVYILYCGNETFDTRVAKPFIAAQTLEAWLKAFGKEKGKIRFKLGKQFNCELKSKATTTLHDVNRITKEVIKKINSAYEESLLFADNERSEYLHSLILGSNYWMNLEVVNHGIIGTCAIIKSGNDRWWTVADQRKHCRTWPLEVDLEGLTLESRLDLSHKVYIIRNLVKSIKYKAERFHMSEYDAWVQTAMYLTISDNSQYFLRMTPEEFFYLNEESRGELLRFIDGAPSQHMRSPAYCSIEFELNEFMCDRNTVARVISNVARMKNTETFFTEDWFVSELPKGWRGEHSVGRASVFGLRLSELSDTSKTIGSYTYRILIEVVRKYKGHGAAKKTYLSIGMLPEVMQYPDSMKNIESLERQVSITPGRWDEGIAKLVESIKSCKHDLEQYKEGTDKEGTDK